jgi:hypothetical protein
MAWDPWLRAEVIRGADSRKDSVDGPGPPRVDHHQRPAVDSGDDSQRDSLRDVRSQDQSQDGSGAAANREQLAGCGSLHAGVSRLPQQRVNSGWQRRGPR